MKTIKRLWLSLILWLGGTAPALAADAPLHWDAMEKKAAPKFEDGEVGFEFHVTNASDHAVKVYYVRPTCSCTTVEAPPMPWILAPGAQGTVKATVDFRGKEGEIAKQLLVGTVEATQTLTMIINVPPMTPEMRERNRAVATANRQKVFQGECADCHAKPAEKRVADDLFAAACAICHESKHRASMVPDLTIAKEKRDAAWWTQWIENGREGTLMPGFAQKNGGPLTESQIESLVDYLVSNFPTEPKTN